VKQRPITIITELNKKYTTEDESFILSPFVDNTMKEAVVETEEEQQTGQNDNNLESDEVKEEEGQADKNQVNNT